MPAKAALIAVLLIERAMCLDCIGAKAGISTAEVERYLAGFGASLGLRRRENDRCPTCGTDATVVSLNRSFD